MIITHIEVIKYTSKKTGKLVEGTKFHLIYPVTPDGQYKVTTEFVSNVVAIPRDLCVGMSVDFQYNRYGAVTGVIVLDTETGTVCI